MNTANCGSMKSQMAGIGMHLPLPTLLLSYCPPAVFAQSCGLDLAEGGWHSLICHLFFSNRFLFSFKA